MIAERLPLAIVACCILQLPGCFAAAQGYAPWVRPMQALLAQRDRHFTVTFVSGTPPETVVLHADYTGPATPSQALYDAGDGNWSAYTSNTITMAGSYLKLKGDWRTGLGRYKGMMYNSLAGAGYTCEFSGTLDYAATATGAVRPKMSKTSSFRSSWAGLLQVWHMVGLRC
jgi:hypothetical protein